MKPAEESGRGGDRGGDPGERERPGPSPLVVAAFEPFGGRRRNRSWEAVSRLGDRSELRRFRLPVDFSRLEGGVREIARARPRAVLLVGEAPSREVRVEGVALNLLDSRRPDNAGHVVSEATLVPGAPLALRARWDAGGIADALRRRGVPASPSFHAGTYACNAVLYLCLNRLPADIPIGFLHVPRARWPWGPRTRTLVQAISITLELLGTPEDPAPAEPS